MSLIPLTEADLDLILPWRYVPDLRRNRYTHQERASDDLVAWLARMRKDRTTRWFVFRDDSNTPQGMVCFFALDPIQDAACLQVYVEPGTLPAAFLRIQYAALDIGFRELNLRKINSEIPELCSVKISLQRRVGFRVEGQLQVQDTEGIGHTEVVRLSILLSDWENVQANLRDAIAQEGIRSDIDRTEPKYHITILSDVRSWINAEVAELVIRWSGAGHCVSWAHSVAQAQAGDFCFCLSFSEILPKAARARYRHALVVHASDLPQGKGWSPLTWRILEGQSCIPVTLFEAADRVDSGVIYAQQWLQFVGHELIDELRHALAEATISLCSDFVDRYPASLASARAQSGVESFYRRRTPEDSRLDPGQALTSQFNLLRVVDNREYPAFFEYHGHCYRLRISKE